MDASTELAIRENLEYDGDTGKLFWKTARSGVTKGREAGSKNKYGYIRVRIAGKRIKAHSLTWFLFYGKWPKKEIDHIDGDPSNNKVENLRDVPHRINSGNRKMHRAGNLVGATFLERCQQNPWQSQIRFGNKCVYLGCFPTEIEAHQAYIKAYKEGVGDE